MIWMEDSGYGKHLSKQTLNRIIVLPWNFVDFEEDRVGAGTIKQEQTNCTSELNRLTL